MALAPLETARRRGVQLICIVDVGFGDEENGWWALTAWLGGAVVASLVLGFQGLPYQMPARCLIGTASWCLCEAWDRRVAQRYIQ